jgi:hypothetical protein
MAISARGMTVWTRSIDTVRKAGALSAITSHSTSRAITIGSCMMKYQCWSKMSHFMYACKYIWKSSVAANTSGKESLIVWSPALMTAMAGKSSKKWIREEVDTPVRKLKEAEGWIERYVDTVSRPI